MAGERQARVTIRVEVLRRGPAAAWPEQLADRAIRIRAQWAADKVAREMERRLNQLLDEAEATRV